MSKTLCEWSRKDIDRHLDRLADLVREPVFACEKCARCANTARVLCRAIPLPVNGADKRRRPTEDDRIAAARALLDEIT